MSKRETENPLSPSQFLLLLHSVPYLGEKTLTRLLRGHAQQRLSSEAFLNLPVQTLREQYELDARAATYLHDRRTELLAQSAELARIVRTHPLQVLTVASATYPMRLERNEEIPPPILYTLGNATLVDPPRKGPPARFTFTVAVSNGASTAVLSRLDEIASDLAQRGGVPVTGHDRTPYQRLALAAQRRNLPILYVFDRGLREALGPEFDRPPFAAARIRDAVFDRKRDLAISPFRLNDHGIGANNRRRDSLIFALSDLIIALDVRAGGGMTAECSKAYAQGRPVFVAEAGRDGNQALLAEGMPTLPHPESWNDQMLARL